MQESCKWQINKYHLPQLITAIVLGIAEGEDF
jgi:hypothetical protein